MSRGWVGDQNGREGQKKRQRWRNKGVSHWVSKDSKGSEGEARWGGGAVAGWEREGHLEGPPPPPHSPWQIIPPHFYNILGASHPLLTIATAARSLTLACFSSHTEPQQHNRPGEIFNSSSAWTHTNPILLWLSLACTVCSLICFFFFLHSLPTALKAHMFLLLHFWALSEVFPLLSFGM